MSAVLYCVYTNGLFEELRRLNIGCCVGDNYVGVIGYADDLFLMAPSIDGLQKMLSVCERYALSHNLTFSTDCNPRKSKTKCIGFLLKDRELPAMKLCGNHLPWVKEGKHLGMKIKNTLGMILNSDIVEKRAQYIDRNNELMQEFSFADRKTKTFINNVFNTSFYGSVLWDLQCKEAEMLYNTWSVSLRKINMLERNTHRYFIEPISDTTHIKLALKKRFLNFTKKISTTKKCAARNIFNLIKYDCRSTTGKNLRSIMLECGSMDVDSITSKDIATIDFYPVPPNEQWRIGLAIELLEARDEGNFPFGWNKDDINETIAYVCST